MGTQSCSLDGLPLFQGCNEGTLALLGKNSQRLSLRVRETLFHPGSAEEGVYVLFSGSGFRYAVTRQGQRRVLELCPPGRLLNSLCPGEDASFVHWEMLEPGAVLSFPREVFFQAMQRDFTLVRRVLEQQEQQRRRLERRLRNGVSSLHARQRMASELLELAADIGEETAQGIRIPLPITVTLLADLLGIPRETASRLRKSLEEEGLLSVNARRLTLTDRLGLERLCQETGSP